MTKKYFVKDESLHGTDNDMFNYSSIAQVLDDILSTNTPPYNVAIIGKWGLGKSSLINLVTERYRKDRKHFQIQEINAWKYEKESLRKVFLKQLWQGVSNQRIQSFETVKRELASIINAELPKDPPGKDPVRTKRFFWTLLIIGVLSVLAFIIYKIVQAHSLGVPIWTSSFWIHVFLRYCENAGTVLIGPVLVALCKMLMDDYHARQTKKIELNFPIETTDDYEIFLETRIKEQLSENPELKIITVIDDLDRLSIDKIVEALDALKAFVGFERCIFIVPFDDEIIKCALDKRKMQEFNNRTDVTDVVESELILDKLFQFRIYLPPLLDFDIQQYAFNLAQQEVPDFISEYCNESLLKKVVDRVLIYPGVTTPRQVKKLLNAFITNLMIISAREASEKIQRGLLTSEDGIMQIAKMSVLQADFNSFYDLLFKDIRCIELLLSAHREEKAPEDLPVYLRNYFEKDKDTLPAKLKSEHETLLNFLHRTAKYHIDNIAPYLYLAQPEISIRTGDELQRRALNALKSKNVQTLRMLLEESADLADVILYHLSREQDEPADILWVTIMVYKDIDAARRPRLAQCIIERTIELDLFESEFLYSIPPEIIFNIARDGENDDFSHQFRELYLTVLSNEDWYEKETLKDALPGIFENISVLNNESKNMLKHICSFCTENDAMDAASLFGVVAAEKPEFVEYWGMKWYRKLCAYIESEGDFSDTTSAHLSAAFNALKHIVPIDELMEHILPLTQYDAFLPIADSIINMPYEEGRPECIKNLISEETAALLLKNVISHDFDKNEDLVCHILDGLRYTITEENSAAMDKFTLNYERSYNLDNIFVYCGQQGYFSLLPETIAGISEAVFRDDKNDELLDKVACFFTGTQIKTLGKKVFDACTYNSSKNYERELSVIRVLSDIEEFADELEIIADSKILPQFSSYYQHEHYRNFVSEAMSLIKDVLPQTCMDKYIKLLAAQYSSYRRFVLTAINKVSMKMSGNAFKEVFEKITTQSEPADFELAFEIIQNHNELRPADKDNLRRYISFLVENLPSAEDPERILRTIRRTFSSISISMLSDMAVNAQKNPECSNKEIAKTVAHFIDRKEDIAAAADNLRTLCEAGVTKNVLSSAISEIKNYKKADIYTQLIDELSKSASPLILTGVSNIANHDLALKPACTLIITCLQKSFEKADLVDCSLDIIDSITENGSAFQKYKEELAEVLRNGFTSTTSERLKKSILLAVSSLKIKRQFKKNLTGEELDYYKKWIS